MGALGLEVDTVSVSFGGVHAVQDLSIELPAGGRVAVIGPNGAGKSTLVRAIAGDHQPDTGVVRFEGQDLDGVPPHTRARRGMGRTFQNLEMFTSMTVLDNVLTALDHEQSLLASLRSPGRARQRRARALEALELFDVAQYADVVAGALPYGVRKLVELSRALVTEPRLLLLDEPVAGLSDPESFVAALTHAVDDRGCAVLLVEHHMPTVKTLCDSVYVMNVGRVIAQGTFAEVSSDPRVVEAYLGTQG